MPTHFACAVIWRRHPDTEDIEFLVIDSVSSDRRTGLKSEKQTKFPGGMNRVPSEPLEVTIKREVLEETYLAFTRWQRIWEKQTAEHTKYGFLVRYEDCRGELRRESLNDNGDEMSPPYWVSASTLGRILFHTHQLPFLAACRELGVL